jgi:GNAT superfamily N-acetyltransferase
MSRVEIRDFEPRYHDAFRDLNLEWITRYFEVEPSDEQVLDDPQGQILEPGGFIFVACESDTVAGVCALMSKGDGKYQLAKMAVSPSFQGRGIGRLLGQAAIDRARLSGASEIELYTNDRLTPALSLYRSLGFRHVPHEGGEHKRSNVRMVLDI